MEARTLHTGRRMTPAPRPHCWECGDRLSHTQARHARSIVQATLCPDCLTWARHMLHGAPTHEGGYER